MPNPKDFSISPSDREELESWIRKGTKQQRDVLRARIILLLSDNTPPAQVARSLGCGRSAVFKWRERFEQAGIPGLKDAPRSGQPTKITPKIRQKVLDMTVHTIPKEASHWSVRLMVKYAGITHWQVTQVWKEAGLKPHILHTFKISNDPLFAEKVVDIVGIYMDPPDNAVVLSVDEKTQIQALDRTQPMLPLKPGIAECRTHDYKRHGTVNLYAAFDILTGKALSRITQRHRAKEFLSFLKQIDRSVPQGLDLHLILDNSSTHKTPKVKEWLEEHPRFVIHFTPTSASWLNAVEGWFAQLERRSLHRGSFNSTEELRKEIKRFIKAHNEESSKPFIWKKSAEAILTSVAEAKLSLLNKRFAN